MTNTKTITNTPHINNNVPGTVEFRYQIWCDHDPMTIEHVELELIKLIQEAGWTIEFNSVAIVKNQV